MRELETTFIIQPEITDEGCQAIFDRLDGIFDKAGSTRLLFDDQGKRKLAYEIKNFQKGRYVTVNYFDAGQVVADVERTLRLDESILRYLTVRIADKVTDIDGRKSAAVEEEKVRKQRAIERAEREAEEARAREAEEARAREAAEAEAAEAAAAAEAQAAAGTEADGAGEAAAEDTGTAEATEAEKPAADAGEDA